MTGLTLADVAAATGGRLDAADGDEPVAAVTVDSRTVRPGALFVALRGERVDGHEFAAVAVAAGAAGVLAARPVGAPAVVVDDVLAGLGALARYHLDRLAGITVIGVTGSSGKTTTKDLLAALLERLGPTVAPLGSYNNEIGLPLTVLAATDRTQFLVCEYGARGRGHIAGLARIAPPDLAVVLNVGVAHLGEFGDREAIAAAKAELVAALAAGGVAVLNADDSRVAAMADRAPGLVLRVGQQPGCDLRAMDVSLASDGRASFALATAGGTAPVRLRLVGRHQVGNALAAAAVAMYLGLPLAETASALSTAQPRSRWRMEVSERPDGVLVVNDAYNANPDSVRAALTALIEIAAARAGRAVAVLGEMAELGPAGAAEHAAIGRAAVRLGVARIIVVGPAARRIHAGALAESGSESGPESTDEAAAEPIHELISESSTESIPVSVYADGVDAAIEMLLTEAIPGDVVLVKGSRVAGLERVAAALLAAQGVSA